MLPCALVSFQNPETSRAFVVPLAHVDTRLSELMRRGDLTRCTFDERWCVQTGSIPAATVENGRQLFGALRQLAAAKRAFLATPVGDGRLAVPQGVAVVYAVAPPHPFYMSLDV